jgi:hypothetical protein
LIFLSKAKSFKECCLVFHQTRYAVFKFAFEVFEFQT